MRLSTRPLQGFFKITKQHFLFNCNSSINISRQHFLLNLSQRFKVSSSVRNNIPQFRHYTFSHSVQCSSTTYEHSPEAPSSGTLGKISPKLFLAFTCKICNTRIEKHISKIAYTKGVVIVRCDKCEENHLIADNLGWFPDLKSARNIEDIMADKGETVRKTADFQVEEVAK